MIEKYIEAKKYAWSETTKRTVAAKLRSAHHLLDKTPEQVYEELSKRYAPYSVKQYLIIMGGYNEWLKGNNQFGSFVKQNARLFKSAYKKRKVTLSYPEAVKAINSIQDNAVRGTCLFILHSGLRISEVYKCSGSVVGKGNKRRQVYVDTPKTLGSPSKVRRALARVGLKPHDLRKLCATRLAEKGADPATLCEVFGWSNISTAYNYLQPKKEDEIRELLNADLRS